MKFKTNTFREDNKILFSVSQRRNENFFKFLSLIGLEKKFGWKTITQEMDEPNLWAIANDMICIAKENEDVVFGEKEVEDIFGKRDQKLLAKKCQKIFLMT